jgi:hypothetical protein
MPPDRSDAFMPRVPFSPYSVREFASMVWRRFTPPAPPVPLARDLTLAPDAPETWIGFVGDVCPLFGREVVFAPAVRAFFGACDRMVGNFEGVFSDRRWRPFLMKHEPDIFGVLDELHPLDGWTLSLANNHAADFGPRDLARTTEALDARGIRWLGTRARPRVALGEGITLTAWTRWSNRSTQAVVRRDPGAPEAPGLHIAFPHWGYEHERTPRAEQAPPAGYALTVGHHSHLPQPFERTDDGRLVAWSLGNFVTGKRLRVLGEGLLLKVGLARPGGGPPRVVRVSTRPIALDRLDPRYCRVALRGE